MSSPHYGIHVVNYMRTHWKPNPDLIGLVLVTYRGINSPNWWSARSIVIPWVIEHGNRYIVCFVLPKKKKIIVMDPGYWDLNAQEQGYVQLELEPLRFFLPLWLAGGLYWTSNIHGWRDKTYSFEFEFAPSDQVIKNRRENSNGPIAIMNIERWISGCPDVTNVDDMLDVYRKIVACRIFSHRK